MSTVSSWKKVNLHWVGGWNKVADEIYELTEPDMCAWKTCAEMHLVWASAASNLSTYEELTYSQLISKILLTDCRGQKGICNCSQALLAWAKPSSGTRLGDEVLTIFFIFLRLEMGFCIKRFLWKLEHQQCETPGVSGSQLPPSLPLVMLAGAALELVSNKNGMGHRFPISAQLVDPRDIHLEEKSDGQV